jgi:hypothetical protein
VKFSVSNLGRIESAEFDIKPLTIFIGKANTNKTWAAYALYGLARSLARTLRAAPFTFQDAPLCTALDTAIDRIADATADRLVALFKGGAEGEARQPFTTEVTRAQILELAEPIGATIRFSHSNDEIAALLAVDGTVLSGANASLEFDHNDFVSQGKVRSVVFGWNKQYWTIGGVLASGAAVQRFAFGLSPDQVTAQALKIHVLPGLWWLAGAVFDEVMAFPSERKGLAVALKFLEAPQNAAALASANLSVPATDYLRFLSQSQRFATKQPTSKIVGHLENEVMNGRADFHGPVDTRVFGFASTSGLIVQMNASASFIRSMAGLDLYLRNVPNHDVVVIDEPEMNAHPEAQLKLVELFAIMANQGRHVIITTHSPYFVDHLNNLMQGARLSPESRQHMAADLKLRDPDAFISCGNVSAYLFNDDGKPQNLISDGFFDLESFAVESDYTGNLGRKIELAESEQTGDGAQ